MDEDKGLEIVNRNLRRVERPWSNAEAEHDIYVGFIKDGEQEADIWIEELQRNFGNAMEKEIRYTQSKV